MRRLRTSDVDLYLIHWPSRNIPLGESFRALNAAAQRGLVRYNGVSNFDLRQLQEAVTLSATTLATNQVPYSLADRRYAENGVLRYCQERGILLTAYSPLKGGVLQDRGVQAVAREYNITPAQVAPSVITIPKSGDRQRLKENLEAADLDLPPEALDALNR